MRAMRAGMCRVIRDRVAFMGKVDDPDMPEEEFEYEQ